MANAYKYQAENLVDKLFQRGLIDANGNSMFVQTLLNKTLEFDENAYFWSEHFRIGRKIGLDINNPRATPAFNINNITTPMSVMPDGHVGMAEVRQIDNEGYEKVTGNLPEYGLGLFQDSLSKEELKARLAQLDFTTRSELEQYVVGVGNIVKGFNSALSYAAAQVLSKGGAFVNASGVKYDFPAYVPATNFKKVDTIFTSADCNIPEELRKIEQDFRQSTNYSGAIEWNISYDDIVNTYLNNKYWIAEVNRYIRLYAPDKVIVVNTTGAGVDTSIISLEQLVAYSQSPISKVAPIRVIREKHEYANSMTSTTTAKGWQEHIAVLRPMGFAGEIVHSDIPKIEMIKREAANTLDWSTATIEGGLFHILNMSMADGILKQYHIDVYSTAHPVLYDFIHTYIVDTNQAN